jgi:hypothetical protein
MKSFIKLFAVLLIIGSSIWITPYKASAQQMSVSLQIFYDQLSPYGRWANNPDYGYVWIPRVHKGFSPYGSDGHWVFTDDGWTWVSNYSWGWAPFHYGRWHSDSHYGWIWIPDTEWGPAWVSWRRSEGYFGWAPLGPGISVNIAIGREYNIPHQHWIFVRDRDIERPDVNRYYVNKTNNVTIIKKSTVIVNTHVDNSRHVTYIAGPDKDDVQKATGKTVKTITVKENDKPGQKIDHDDLHIYKPRVQKNNNDGKAPVPAKVVKLKHMKQSDNRKPDSKP